MSFVTWLKRRVKRKGLGIFLPVAILAFFSPSPAMASSYTVTEESEWSFTVVETELVYIYGNSNRDCNQPGTDPYLWLYNSSGTLVAQNDDGNHGPGQCVSSKIVTSLQPDTYTIRAGYCCSQRNLGSNPSGNYTYELIILNYDLDGSGTTTTSTTTTTVAPYIGPPMNLDGSIVEVWVGDQVSGGVYLNWDAPNTGNVEPERYAISWRIPPDAGWGVSTGNVGDENALNTEITLPFSLFESTGGFGEQYVFDIRADNDTLGVYSGWSTQLTLVVEQPTPPTTTTTTTVPPTTTTTVPPTTTTTTVPPTTTTTTSTTVAPTTTTTSTTSTTTTTLPPTTTTEVPPSTTTTIPATTTTLTVPPTTSSTTSSTSTTTTSTSTTTTTTTTTTVPPTTTSTTIPTTTTSTTTTVPLTPTTEPENEAVAKLPDQPAEGVLDQEDVEGLSDQEIAVVVSIEDQALAEDVAELLDGDITTEDIEAIISSEESLEELSDEALYVISEALSDADQDVKEEFEAEINIFSGDFDNYVPTGSTVDVGTRRVVTVATTGALILAPAASQSNGGRNAKK